MKLTGSKSNREAIGAEVLLTMNDGTTLQRSVSPTRSYQSQVELPVTFGLGTADTVKHLVIHWPDGAKQTVSVDGVDRLLEVTQEP